MLRSLFTASSACLPAAARASTRWAALHTSAPLSALEYNFPNVKQALVEDVRVNVTFVNYLGQRTTLPGRVGQTLLTLAQEHDYNWLEAQCGGGAVESINHGDWKEPKYGEGAFCVACHVIVPKASFDKMPAVMPDEAQLLSEHPFEGAVTSTSRLGCQVRLTKSLDGMVVHIPDGPSNDIP